jgi:hypothetical protein
VNASVVSALQILRVRSPAGNDPNPLQGQAGTEQPSFTRQYATPACFN